MLAVIIRTAFVSDHLPERVQGFHGDALDNYFRVARGRSAQAVGQATTTAVVHSIVGIIVATAVITILCNVLGV